MNNLSVKETPGRQVRRVSQWNERYRIGQRVSVLLDDATTRETTTNSHAWMLGGHTAVIGLDGITGAYALRRVSALQP